MDEGTVSISLCWPLLTDGLKEDPASGTGSRICSACSGAEVAVGTGGTSGANLPGTGVERGSIRAVGGRAKDSFQALGGTPSPCSGVSGESDWFEEATSLLSWRFSGVLRYVEGEKIDPSTGWIAPPGASA